MVFYRKYRPQTVLQLDSKEVRETLYSVLSKKESPHAFLFTGPKGLGKTSTARIVAKVLNCEKKSKSKDIEPCNECEQCISITNGTSMDILEIDAASNRGIDEIRDLREKIRLSPLTARKKVYIIDEVHMLTTEAFNALLKTLEEPPSHVVFILCTTELHKVPATILSRCFHIKFTLATPEELKRSFQRIIESEKIKIDDDALLYIAQLSDGSFRDGTKLLEEVSLHAGSKTITKQLIEEKHSGTNVSVLLQELFNALLDKDTKSSLSVVGKLVEQGGDIKYFIESFIQELHVLMLETIGMEGKKSSLGSGKKIDILAIRSLIEILGEAHKNLKSTVIPQLPLELAIIEYSQSAQNHAELKTQNKTEVSVVPRMVPQSSASPTILKDLMQHLKSDNPSLVGLLRGFGVQKYNDTVLVLETKYTYHKQRLEEKKMLGILRDAVREITGKEIDIVISLSS